VRATTHARAQRGTHEAEWRNAELAERVELLESQVKALRVERERLWTDLRVAQLWVKELTLWLDEAQTRMGDAALLLPTPAPELSPETLAALREHEKTPMPWRRMATVAAVAMVPWALIAGIVSLIWFVLL
jgi:hypothetical protein